jgi:Fe-S cluster biogenesis protein NfuA
MNNIGELIPILGILVGVIVPLGAFFFVYHEGKNKNETIIEISKNLDDSSKVEELLKIFEERKKEPIEVFAEATPNPSTMKFGTNKSLTNTDVEYINIEEASKSSPLAKALFGFSFVKEVFISENYISITKFDIVEWNDIYSEIRSFISSYLQENKIIIKELPKSNSTTNNPKEKEDDIINFEGTSAKIVAILDEYIRPAVASDGGNIAFKSYNEETKIVKVVLQGACSGCPSSTITLKNGIETMLQEMLPNEISQVVAING